MSRTIPEVRASLHELANEVEAFNAAWAERIRHHIEELKRRRPVRRSPVRAKAITDEIKARVREFAKAHPSAPNRDIGRLFGIDGGRVSEILAGKRGAE